MPKEMVAPPAGKSIGPLTARLIATVRNGQTPLATLRWTREDAVACSVKMLEAEVRRKEVGRAVLKQRPGAFVSCQLPSRASSTRPSNRPTTFAGRCQSLSNGNTFFLKLTLSYCCPVGFEPFWQSCKSTYRGTDERGAQRLVSESAYTVQLGSGLTCSAARHWHRELALANRVYPCRP